MRKIIKEKNDNHQVYTREKINNSTEILIQLNSPLDHKLKIEEIIDVNNNRKKSKELLRNKKKKKI